MNQRDPYNAAGDSEHPGVTGKPFDSSVTPKASPEVVPGQTNMDPTGTGTFPPETQGNLGRAQPAGLSATTEYGVNTADSSEGGKGTATPETNPGPKMQDFAEEEDVPFDEMENQNEGE